MGFSESELISKVSAGVIPGATALTLVGYNASPTTTFETVWMNSNAYTFLTTNMSAPTIVSSSANDTAAGTGARTVSISGVDSSYAVQSETVTLNGVTPVSLVNSYMTINSIIVLTAGSGGVPAGNLTLAAGGTTHGFVTAGFNAARSFIYCVPAGYGLLMYDLLVGEEAASTGGQRSQILFKTNGGLNHISSLVGMPTNFPAQIYLTVPRYFPENTQLQAQFLSGSATGVCTALSHCILLDRSAQSLNLGFARWI